MIETACFLALHLVGSAAGAQAPSFVRRDAISLVSPVSAPNDTILSRAHAFIAFDSRGLYVTETRDEVMRAPCVDRPPPG